MGNGLEILSIEEMTRADQATIAAGTPGEVLMERAGTAVADAICARWAPRPTAVLCGPGANGGDGYVVARLLKKRGWPVWVEALGAPTHPDAVAKEAMWRGRTLPLAPEDGAAELVVDALFGAGLSRPLDDVALQRAQHADALRVVAIDVPSGLDGDTGQVKGEAAFAAVLTVTFHRNKRAHVLYPAKACCGEVVVADIGLTGGLIGGLTERVAGNLFVNRPPLWLRRFPWPAATAHKHDRGRVAVVSGGPWNTGAARLAARGALRIGAGAVTVLAAPDALAPNAAHLEAVMLRSIDSEGELIRAGEEADVVVIGPAAGVGPATAARLHALARTGAAMVVDADALTSFRDDPGRLFSALDRDDVMTPHPGEFERIFPGLLKTSADRIEAAREAARRAGSVVLLKGPDTVVAAPDGRAAVNVVTAPWLATAGSGDVLAGFIAGLIAQGMESFEAACAAAWIHGEGGAAHGPGLIAEDLPGLAPTVLKRLYAIT
jgi:hydroxyethylthiazole kinase-like uncharacterized protein yjeF